MPNPRPRVSVCTPTRVLIYHEAPFCAMRACNLLDKEGYEHSYMRVPGGALLEHVRSIMAHDSMEWGADVLLWIDDDVTFDPYEAVKLVQGAIETESLVACVVALRCGTRVNVAFEDDTDIDFGPDGGLVKAKQVGCGFTAIHRKVFERVAEVRKPVVIVDKYRVPYYRTEFVDDTWPGEDFYFSHLAKTLGLQPYADTSVRAIHHGDYGFRLEDVLRGFASDEKRLTLRAG